MKAFGHFLAVFCCALVLPACSVYMAATQPDKKDLGILTIGISRITVLESLGAPIDSSVKDGQKTDVFRFYEGSDGGWKIGRAGFHAVADVFTLGLWEIVGTPMEVIAKGDKMSAVVLYDADHRVENVTMRKN